MSLYLRLVIGPVVVCDVELFASTTKDKPTDDPPPQLNGGSGTVIDAYVESNALGFAPPRRTLAHGSSTVLASESRSEPARKGSSQQLRLP